MAVEVQMVPHCPLFLPLEPYDQMQRTDGIHCFCVKLRSLESVPLEMPNAEEYQCQMMLFDVSNHNFLGNVWTGERHVNENGEVLLNETVYFYTSLKVKSLLMSIEVIVSTHDSDICRTVAWSGLDLNEVEEKVSVSENSVEYRVPLQYGSSVSLFFLSTASERLSQEKNVCVFELCFEMCVHPLFMRLMHLVPENFLLGTTDAVVGLFQTKKNLLEGHDALRRPQLQKCCTVVLRCVAIKVHPSVDAFEAEVCRKMLEESETDDSLHTLGEVSIVQRHLQVGVHNGFCYVQESDSYRLLVESVVSQGSATQRSSSSSSVRFSRNECLVVRSDVKVPNVPDDPNVTIVFIVEYTLAFKDKSVEINSGAGLGKSSSSTVAVMWGSCSLGTLRGKSSSSISLSLTNCPSQCPNRMLLLKVTPAHSFTLTFEVLKFKKHASPSTSKTTHTARSSDFLSSQSIMATSLPSHLHQLTENSDAFVNQHKFQSNFSIHTTDAAAPVSYDQDYKNLSANEDSTMEEVNVVPSSVPLAASTVQPYSGDPHYQQAVCARLYSLKFPNVHDNKGKTPFVIDTREPYVVDEKKEMHKEGSKVVFQFLGLSGLASNVPSRVFLTFRFYRFPLIRTESLSVKLHESAEPLSSRLYVFQSAYSDNPEFHGYQITYHIDPSQLSSGEHKAFMDALIRGRMCIDIWNAKSLLYFGTVTLPLKYLCRQGKDAVCTNLSLELKRTEFPDDAPGPTIPLKCTLKAQLHARVASIKVPMTVESLSNLKSVSPVVSKASPIVETNMQLSKLMSSRCFSSFNSEESHLSEERRRKLARMEAVRNSMGDSISQYTLDTQNYFRERQRDLAVVESYIEKNKNSMIQNFLQASVMHEKVLYPVQGEKTYFEFLLNNPLDSDQNIFISWTCSELSLVTDAAEAIFLRHYFAVQSRNCPSKIFGVTENTPAVFLHSKETVAIPFKYCLININSVNLKSLVASSGHHMTSDILNVENNLAENDVKVIFETADHSLIAVLHLKIQALPPCSITHSFKFLTPEHSFFQKTMMIDDVTHRPVVRCSASNVTYEFLGQEVQTTSAPFTVFLKAPSGRVGKSQTFFLFIYEDSYLCRPIQTWKISITSVQRVDLSCIAGQVMKSSLVIRGNHASRLVHCLSDSTELSVHPSEAFILAPCSVQEVSLTVKYLLPGVGYFRVNMVDQGMHEALHCWLVVIICQKPLVTKAFQVKLHRGKEAVKRISLQNLSLSVKQYIAQSSHPELLQLKNLKFQVAAKKSFALGLFFPPQENVLSETIFIYLYNDLGRSEETYCVKVTCD